MTCEGLNYRRARPADVPAIRELQARSLRQLGRDHYPKATLEAVIEAGTFQPALLHAGRYLVAARGERIVACGGWLDDGPAAPSGVRAATPKPSARARPAIIRAVYVDPTEARRGIGSALMAAIEADAMAAGKSQASLLATTMAVRFYGRLGYRMQGPLSLALPSGELIEVFAMQKPLVAVPAWLLPKAHATPMARVAA